jgi:hypothetical protein
MSTTKTGHGFSMTTTSSRAVSDPTNIGIHTISTIAADADAQSSLATYNSLVESARSKNWYERLLMPLEEKMAMRKEIERNNLTANAYLEKTRMRLETDLSIMASSLDIVRKAAVIHGQEQFGGYVEGVIQRQLDRVNAGSNEVMAKIGKELDRLPSLHPALAKRFEQNLMQQCDRLMDYYDENFKELLDTLKKTQIDFQGLTTK